MTISCTLLIFKKFQEYRSEWDIAIIAEDYWKLRFQSL